MKTWKVLLDIEWIFYENVSAKSYNWYEPHKPTKNSGQISDALIFVSKTHDWKNLKSCTI